MKLLRITPFILGCCILVSNQSFSQANTQSTTIDIAQLKSKIDSLIQVTSLNHTSFSAKMDSLQAERTEQLISIAQDKIEITNLIIQWIAALLAIITIVLAIAGFIGLREFNEVRLKEREMTARLEETERALEDMKEIRDQVLAESRNTILALYRFSEAETLLEKGRFIQARNKINNVLELIGDASSQLKAEIILLNGKIYKRQEIFQKSIAEINKAIDIFPLHADAYETLGAIYIKLRDFANAEEKLNKAIEISPDSAKVLNNLGELYLMQRKFEQAISIFHQCLELDPEHSAPFLHLGNIYRVYDQIERSKKYFLRALDLCQRRVDAGVKNAHDLYSLGWASLGLNSPDKAVSYIEEAFRFNSSKEIIRELLGYFELLRESPHPPDRLDDLILSLKLKLENDQLL